MENDKIVYNNSFISDAIKNKKSLFFIEELFSGDLKGKAPLTIRKKINSDSLSELETSLKCCYNIIPMSTTKMAFTNYKHFIKTIKEVNLNIKNFF